MVSSRGVIAMLDVMHAKFERVAGGIYAISVWDPPPWKVYTNCYMVMSSDGRLVMIDAGRTGYAPFLAEALAKLSKEPGDISAVVATHNHADHVGASVMVPSAARYIHPEDWRGLPPDLKVHFMPTLPENGRLAGLDFIHLGWHTPGSVAVFHRPTGTLFCGDHLGFFHLPAEGLAGRGRELRERACKRVWQWASDPVERLEDRLDRWLDGIRRLQAYPVTALCPGHGGVLVGDIPEFFSELIRAGSSEPAGERLPDDGTKFL